MSDFLEQLERELRASRERHKSAHTLAARLNVVEKARDVAEKERADFLVALAVLLPFFFPGLDPNIVGDRDAANPEWVKAAKHLLPLLQPAARAKLEAVIAQAPPVATLPTVPTEPAS